MCSSRPLRRAECGYTEYSENVDSAACTPCPNAPNLPGSTGKLGATSAADCGCEEGYEKPAGEPAAPCAPKTCAAGVPPGVGQGVEPCPDGAYGDGENGQQPSGCELRCTPGYRVRSGTPHYTCDKAGEWVPAEGGDAFACGPSSCRITEETLSPRDDPWPGDVLHEYAPGVANATRCGVNGKIDSCGDDGSDPCVIPDGGFCEVDCAEGYEYEVGGAAVQRPMGLHCSTGLAWCNDFSGWCMDTTDLCASNPPHPSPELTFGHLSGRSARCATRRATSPARTTTPASPARR